MSAPTTETGFEVLASGEVAWLRVSGPAICRESGRFESLLRQVEERGYRTLVIDLSQSPRMDSTFAGVLLRLASRAVAPASGGARLRLVLSGVTPQVAELLETLCLDSVFERADVAVPEAMSPLALEARDLSKMEIMALSLDGHERLAELSEANARRFAAVLQALREGLKSPPPPPPPPPSPTPGSGLGPGPGPGLAYESD